MIFFGKSPYFQRIERVIPGNYSSDWEEEKNLCKRIPNNLCRYSTPEEVKYNSPLLKYGLSIVNSF